MTNSTTVLTNNLPSTNTKSIKKSDQPENLSSNKNTDNLCSVTKNCEVKSTVDTEKVLNKTTTTKSKTTRRNRKTLQKKKQETENVNQKATTDRNKIFHECKSEHMSSPDKKIIINKENRISNISKCKEASPNHKLTEYFLNLKVDEHIKNVVSEEVDLKKGQKVKDNEKPTNKTTVNHKQLDSVKNSPKTLRQHKTKTNIELTNHKVTEYFHIRRSERKYTKKIFDEKQIELENKIINETEDGLEIKEFKNKGRGVVTTKQFFKGDFVIEYIGDLINRVTAKEREMQYAKNKKIGCYMYYFKHKNVQYCIDATKESGKLGRLINHSRKGNLVSRIIEIKQIPHLVLFAKTDISIGTEILYDYGDRNQESVRNFPWLVL